MTLPDAIAHALHTAQCSTDPQCADQHKELADWLHELQKLQTVCEAAAHDVLSMMWHTDGEHIWCAACGSEQGQGHVSNCWMNSLLEWHTARHHH